MYSVRCFADKEKLRTLSTGDTIEMVGFYKNYTMMADFNFCNIVN